MTMIKEYKEDIEHANAENQELNASNKRLEEEKDQELASIAEQSKAEKAKSGFGFFGITMPTLFEEEKEEEQKQIDQQTKAASSGGGKRTRRVTT